MSSQINFEDPNDLEASRLLMRLIIFGTNHPDDPAQWQEALEEFRSAYAKASRAFQSTVSQALAPLK